MKILSLSCLVCTLTAASTFAQESASNRRPASERTDFERRASLFSDRLSVYKAFQSEAEPDSAAKAAARDTTTPFPLITTEAVYPIEFRRIDGKGNNASDLGQAGAPVLRKTPNGYGDGIGTMAGANRKGPREISNIVNAQSEPFPNSSNITSFVWQWGQFTDHDISLIRNSNPAEFEFIPVPRGDSTFDPRGGGNKTLPFQRSSWTMVDGVRTQVGAVTSFLDASQIYGSDPTRQSALRTNDGTGRLATSDGDLLPFNVNGLANQPQSQPGKVINPADFFLGGDVRANENTGLTALQTVFMREHNYWAGVIATENPGLDGEGIYQRAKAIVNAETQMITYRDFLPILLGPNPLAPYAGYNPAVDPRVALEFTSAAFRVGHTFLPPVVKRLNSRNRDRPGDIALNSTLFETSLFINTGVEPFLRGHANQVPQQVDAYIIDAVRNFVFLRSQGFDLASLNIQRGRDHGLGSYNQVRIGYGLAPKATFAEMTSNLDFQARLAAAYDSPDDVDLWVGGLCEDHVNGGQVGETFSTILKDQFERLRDGDRFWYEDYLDAATLATVQEQTLASIIKRNTSIGSEMQDDVFHMP
ncbi:MAG: peroxidase family protein [Chthoniobacterales bacterium]